MSTTTHLHSQRRTWSDPRPLLNVQIRQLLPVWAAFLAAVMVFVIGVSRFREVSISGWEAASGSTAWYVGGVAWYLVHKIFPMFVAHGRTRREAAVEIGSVLALFSIVVATLVVVGYLVEHIVYGVAGWPRELSDAHLFTSHTDVLMVLFEYGSILLVWGAAGALVGAATYRFKESGWLALAPASVLVVLIDLPTSPTSNPFDRLVDRVLMVDRPSLPLAIVVAVTCVAAALAMTWPIIRDMPLRNR